MNYHKLAKKDTASQWRALSAAFLIHFVLLGGLYYFNAEDPSAIIPDFVLELLDSQSKEEIAIAKNKAP